MKNILFLLLVFPVVLSGQTTDDFSDGNFTDNPPWTGDVDCFEVNQSGQLHLAGSGNDTAFLSTATVIQDEIEWRFWLRMSFNTSANNYSRIYLGAHEAQLTNSPEGMYLQAGGADDSISLIHQEGGNSRKVFTIKSYRTNHSTNILRFRLIFSKNTWTVMMDSAGGFNFHTEGSFSDKPFDPGPYFGLYCRYTTSNAEKVYFDDVYIGPVIHDTMPPVLTQMQIRSDREILLLFSETIDRGKAMNNTNYYLEAARRYADSVILYPGSGHLISIKFNLPFTEGQYDSLSLTNIFDPAGNRMKDTIIPLVYYIAKSNDVVINEILADPDPVIGLPAGEFIELFNKTLFPIFIGGWQLEFGNYSKTIPDVIIEPGSYLLIVKDSLYLSYGACLLLFSSSSSLSNAGARIVLRNREQQVIHWVTYDPGWYGQSYKAEGGWSLELVDAENPCGCGKNWRASVHFSGGTPGSENSVAANNPDLEAPCILRAIVKQPSTVLIYFSETMDSLTIINPGSWMIVESGECPVSVLPIAPEYQSAELSFEAAFFRGKPYTLEFNGYMKDCAGNVSDTPIGVKTAIPDSVFPGCVQVNEVLSDPAPGGERYVELHNVSDRVVDAGEMLLVTLFDQEGNPLNGEPLSIVSYLLFPEEYFVVTGNPEDIVARFHSPVPERIQKMDFFPAMDNDSGWVGIIGRTNTVVIDKMFYSKSMHFPLLKTNEGVSLERLDPWRNSTDRGNWFSAAESVWFGTPGYRNSHHGQILTEGGVIEVQPPVFSPDNDGYQDIVTILARAETPGSTINLWVFDSRGRVVSEIARNVLSSSEELFTWDGVSNTGNIVQIGIYILLAEILKPDGTSTRVKKTIVVAGRF